MNAAAPRKTARLCRLDLWLNPVFDEIIRATPGEDEGMLSGGRLTEII